MVHGSQERRILEILLIVNGYKKTTERHNKPILYKCNVKSKRKKNRIIRIFNSRKPFILLKVNTHNIAFNFSFHNKSISVSLCESNICYFKPADQFKGTPEVSVELLSGQQISK